jgi:peptidoglycan-N-acetylglucosamine deacetylase
MHPWPDGCDGAVSLTFDDGMKSQLERAVPYLNQVGLRGTFYVNPGSANWQERLAPWRAVAEAGHEVGNHTTKHPCARNIYESPHNVDSLSLADIEADVMDAEQRLNEVLGTRPRTFCYPCYGQHVGAGATRQTYVPVIAKHFVAARGGGVDRAQSNHPLHTDLHYLMSQPCERMWGYEMIGLVERAANQGRWMILTFHGIHEGMLSVADGDLRELCDHLVRHNKRIYTAPVIDVAQRVLEYRKAKTA